MWASPRWGQTACGTSPFPCMRHTREPSCCAARRSSFCNCIRMQSKSSFIFDQSFLEVFPCSTSCCAHLSFCALLALMEVSYLMRRLISPSRKRARKYFVDRLVASIVASPPMGEGDSISILQRFLLSRRPARREPAARTDKPSGSPRDEQPNAARQRRRSDTVQGCNNNNSGAFP